MQHSAELHGWTRFVSMQDLYRGCCNAFAGEGADAVIAYLDGPTSEQVVARARAARIAAGLFTGHAAGIEPEPDPKGALAEPATGVAPEGGLPRRQSQPTGASQNWAPAAAG